jgi:serine/threonine protein kinase
MAEVFKAKSYGVEGFEKIIAIKRILPTMGEDRDFIKMFIDEAKIAGQLAHANICQIFELGRIDGSHFIAMEYIWGKDLLQIQNRLRKIKQQMPVPMACFSIAKVLEGLDYAHRKRDPLGRPLEIVHRDCSPQNVLVSYEGEVKVIDFGIAKATSRNSRTMAGVLKGKFGYMSPEQVRGLPLDRRSDIFALGTMLYECLTGERLFQGETDFSTLEKVRNVDIRNPRDLNPNIPPAVERVILKALAKDVDDRYQWCSEMLADLQQYLMSQDVVFTAKSLSGWLKEVFSGEIEKERQQLEQYKRVGRDGLIAGMPAAEAKLDVVESLGEAGVPEGDATMLGTPSFDDLEAQIAAAAAPEMSPASKPSARPGSQQQPQKASQKSQKSHRKGGDDDDGDFGEEAPTEIFGELDNNPKAVTTPPPLGAAPAGPLPASRGPTAPTAAPQSRPPKPPPGRAPTQGQPAMSAAPQQTPAPSPMVPPAGPLSATRPAAMPLPMTMPTADPSARTMGPQMMQPDAYAAAQPSPQQGYSQQGYPQQNAGYPGAPGSGGYGQQYPQQNSGSGPMQMPLGTPSSMQASSPPQPMNALAPPGSNAAGKTMMGGMAAPATANNYGAQYRVSGQQAAQPYPGQQYPGSQSGPMPMQYPQGQPYGSGQVPQQGYSAGYGQPPGAAAVDPQVPIEGKKKSSIGRDVAIGVAIAALVLGGFLAVKFLILDSGSGGSSSGSAQTSSIATIRLSLPNGVSADLFVDDKKIATVSDKQEIPVTAGQRKVKLVGPNGAKCEQELKLAAGKTTPLECPMKVGPAETNTGSAAGSASTTPGAGSNAGSGSAAVKATETKPVETKPADTKVTETKPTETKPSDTKVAATTTTATTTTTKPTDTKPADTKPADTKTTTTTKPADTKPADTKATTTTTKPADTKATTTTTKPADTKATTTTKPADTKATTTTTKPTDTKTTTTTKPVDTKKPADTKPVEAVAGDKGYLQVQSTPSAKIFVDGVDTGLSTPVGGKQLSLAPGKHKITFAIGGDKFTFAVMIKAGQTEVLKKDLQ